MQLPRTPKTRHRESDDFVLCDGFADWEVILELPQGGSSWTVLTGGGWAQRYLPFSTADALLMSALAVIFLRAAVTGS